MFVHELDAITVDTGQVRLNFATPLFKKMDVTWLKSSLALRAEEFEAPAFATNENDHSSVVNFSGKSQIIQGHSSWDVEFDIFGQIFYLLTCYEAAVSKLTDNHGRFLSKDSFLDEKFIQRPLVEEYLILLERILNKNGLNCSRKSEYKDIVTCDVDWPLNPSERNLYYYLKNGVSDIIRLNITNLITNTAGVLARRLNPKCKDKYQLGIDFLLELAVSTKCELILFLMFNNYHYNDPPRFEVLYEEDYQKLINNICRADIKTGIHPGYINSTDSNAIRNIISIFYSSISRKNIEVISRNHFLRWDAVSSPRVLYEAGVQRDFTVAFADLPGFRCGTSRPFKLYDLKERCVLDTWEHPLVVMESTVIDAHYLNLGISTAARDYFCRLRNICKQFDIPFTLLWHNSELFTLKRKQLLEGIFV